MPADAFRAGQRLVEVLGGEHAERDRHPRVELRLLDARRALARDLFVVRGLAADDASDADDPVDPPGPGDRLGGEGQLERPGHPVLAHLGHPQVGQATPRPVEQAQRDVVVEPARHHGDAQARAAQVGVDAMFGADVVSHGPTR